MIDPVKNALLQWVDDQRQLSEGEKNVLHRLALYADAECCAWAAVPTLAAACNISVRAVQYRLRRLEDEGLISLTGETHRLKDSTRSVPVYQIAPGVEGLGEDERAVSPKARKAKSERATTPSMGANLAPIDEAHGCKDGGAMGASCCTRKEPRNLDEKADAFSERARAGEFSDLFLAEAFRRCVAAYPASALPSMDEPEAFAAFRFAAVEVDDPDLVVAAAVRFTAHLASLGRKWPKSLQWFLTSGPWRTYASADAPSAQGADVAPTAAAGPADPLAAMPDLQAALTEAMGATWVASWFARAVVDAAAGVIRLGPTARRQIEGQWRAAQIIKHHGITLAEAPASIPVPVTA